MDKDQARFILQSFRPDGADAKDPDFAEALAVAAEDRELGDWLAAERAQDAAFAAALSCVAIPDELRENILRVLKGDHDEAAGEYSGMDAAFIGALASVTPPEGLRDQIVTAMGVENTTGTPALQARSAPRRVQGWLKTAAVAAALVLGAFVALEITDGSKDRIKPLATTFTLDRLEHKSIEQVASKPEFALVATKMADVSEFLVKQNLPKIDMEDLPSGLAGGKPVGCTLFKVDESNAALVCFNKNGTLVHLVVVPRKDLDLTKHKLDTLATLKKGDGRCWQCPNTSVSVAAWSNAGDNRAFLLLGEMEEKELRKFF